MPTTPTPGPRRWVAALAAISMPLVGLVATPLVAHAAPVVPPVAGDLVWKVSNQFVDHFTPKMWAPDSSLVATDGATLDDANVTTFSSGSGWADPATGESSIQYRGSLTGTFVAGGATQYSVSLSDPEVTVAAGKGEVRADVEWTVPGNADPNPTSGGGDDVLLTTFTAAAADWTSRTLTTTPDWEDVLPANSDEALALGIPADKPVNGKAWSPDLLESLDSGLRAHFYASGSASDQNKSPSELTASAPAPTTTAAVTDASPTGLDVKVDGSGFAPTGTGIYVGVTEAGEVDPVNASAYLGTKWLPRSAIGADGTFSVDLVTIAPDDLDDTLTYEVHTMKAHGIAATDPSQNVRTPLDIDFSAFDREPATIRTKRVTTVYGKGGAINVEVPGASGTATLELAGKTTNRSLVNSRATFTVPKNLRGGTYVAQINYGGSTVHEPTSTTRKVIVNQARTKTTIRTTRKPTTKATGQVVVTVANISGTAKVPSGKVRVTWTKGSSTWTRTVKLRGGKATVTLPKRAKGAWTASYSYLGKADFFKPSAKKVTTTVKR